MSSAAVQHHTPQQYNERFASADYTSSPPSSRRAGRQAGGNGSAVMTPQTNAYSSPLSSPPASTTRGQGMASSSQASPAAPLHTSTYQQWQPDSTASGPAISLPIRTSSQQAPTSATATAGQYDAERERANESDRRQKAQISPQQDPGSASRAQRSRQAPTQSRSATAVGQPPIDTSLPREHSAIINHIVVDDPQTDIARERARVAEAQPNQQGGAIPPSVDQTTPLDPEQRQRSRQEHLKQQPHRKEVKFGDYILGQTLGEGEFGKVKMGWKKDSSVQVAIKLIRKESLQGNANRLPKIYREISILRELQHPNIVRLHEFVETERHMGIILEYASGGELFDFILNQRYLKDPQARRLFAQLVSGVGYLHKKGIVHRDLKLENLLLDRNKNIIITDFGFANTFNPNDELGEEVEHRIMDKDFVKRERLGEPNAEGVRRGDLMQTSCGSPCYAAPELVVSDGLYTGRKVDVWSCGVILYAMLAGYLPFDDDPANPEGDNINLLYKYIVNTPLTFPEYVTPHARDLLRRILVADPRKRADLFEVARHSWLQDYSHVVGFIGSSTKSDVDIAASAMQQGEASALGRSASVREPTTKTPTSGGGAQKQTAQAENPQAEARGTTRDAKRRTVQLEYVAPKENTARTGGEAAAAAAVVGVAGASAVTGSAGRTRARGDSQGPVEVQSSTRKEPQIARKDIPASQAMPPPLRTPQQRAASDAPVSSTQGFAPTSRPGTSGTLGSRAMPSRGNSYSQPALATSTNTNAQAQLSQPKSSSGYIITGPVQGEQSASSSRPMSQQNLAQFQQQQAQQQQQRGHKRSSTLGSIGDRLLGRSSSRRSSQQRQQDAQPEGVTPITSEKRTRSRYPPLSMKNPIPNDQPPLQSRPSTESTRRTSFGFSRRNSNVPSEEKRSSKRFSFLPSMSSFTGRKDSSTDSGVQTQGYSRDGRPPSKGIGTGYAQAQQNDSRTPSESTNSSIPMPYDRRVGSQQQHQQTGYDKALPPPPGSARANANPYDNSNAGTTPTQQNFSHLPIASAYSSQQQQPYATSNKSTPVQNQSYAPPPTSSVAQQQQAYPSPPPIQRKQYRDDGYGSNLLGTSSPQSQPQIPGSGISEPVERFYTPTGDLEGDKQQQGADFSGGRSGYAQPILQSQPQAQGSYAGSGGYDDGYGYPKQSFSVSRPGQPQGQGQGQVQVLRPNQRNFGEEQYERGNSGSSSAGRRVMDFFRRRGREREE